MVPAKNYFYKRLIINYFLFAFFLSFSLHANTFAQLEPYFETVRLKDDINKVITRMVQDNDGFIWFGTQRGLYRYDGYNFKQFQHSPSDPTSLPDNFIQTLALAPDGKLWVGTVSGGLAIYNAETETFSRQPITASESNRFHHIHDIVHHNNGEIWVAGNGGIAKRDIMGMWQTYSFGNNDALGIKLGRMNKFIIDDRGTLWLGGPDGLMWRDNLGRFHPFVAENQDGAINIGNMLLARDGKLWLSTRDNGAAWLSITDKKLHWLSRDNNDNPIGEITTLVQVSDAEIWLGSYGNGIYVVNSSTGHIKAHYRHDPSTNGSLANDYLGSLLVERSGIVWIGTWGEGLQRWNPNGFLSLRHHAHNNKTLSKSEISAILERKNGQLLIGYSGGGIDSFDRATGNKGSALTQTELSTIFTDKRISGIDESQNGDLWIATFSAVYLKKAADNTFRRFTSQNGLPSTRINELKILQNGEVWVTSNTGVFTFSADNDGFVVVKTAVNDSINSACYPIAEQANGRVWVGCFNGIWVKEPGDKTLRNIQAGSNGLNSNRVGSLLVDSKDSLWLSTAGGLHHLLSWDGQNAKFESINERLNTPGLFFGYDPLEDQFGRIWTAQHMFDPSTQSLYVLDRADGIDIGSPILTAKAKTLDGLLLYGGTQGILVIEPAKFMPWNYNPPIVVTHLTIDNLPKPAANITSGLTLKPTQQQFNIEFAALDYSNPAKVQYEFRLDGYETDWVSTGFERRIAAYGNLWPGNYNLEIRATNRSGIWSQQSLKIPIIVLPAYWQQPWFFLLLALLLFVGIYIGIKWRTRLLQRKAAMLTALVHEQTLELEAKNAELLAANTSLELMSLTDQLTGLKNRHFLALHINDDIDLLKRKNLELSSSGDIQDNLAVQHLFFLIDIDHFKQVNDVYGHAAGDAVLKQMHPIMQSVFRESDYLIRFGGEEFLAIARFTSAEGAARLAERLRLAVESHDFAIGDGKILKKTCSIGFTGLPFLPGSPETLSWQEVMDIADQCLYFAKRNSRNAWAGLFGTRLCRTSDLYNGITKDINAMIQNDELTLLTSIKDVTQAKW